MSLGSHCFQLAEYCFLEKKSIRSRIIGQSHDFEGHSLFVSLIASFAPKRSEGANDAKGDTNKLYVQQKLFDYHYYQYTRPNRTKFIS